MSASRVLLGCGVLLTVMGAVWALQGAGLLAGSVMSDDRRWLVIGVATMVVGGFLGYRSRGR